ncbi:M1 family metallopeptidase [Stakelama saccharophila]|uniref:Aminopeptidase N n=1 Tax=Stakelama saccharophila TaxID=3075605 RepID=A0ABZ0BBN0_9SPHN|nr:M1 family metallopeptidase [Stakelama sp. W311]WNO54460.1 M1 family metallopeptidase [Stakelama sp. W311]
MSLRIFGAAALAGALAACTGTASDAASSPAPSGSPAADASAPAVAPVLLTPEARDVHSYAVPSVARVTHVALDLSADFDAHVLRGTATLDIKAADDANQIVLDTRDLRIASVTDGRGRTLPWKVGESHPAHGAPLTVGLDGTDRIKITYATAPDAPALQWLSPKQTAGGKYPYLFSQGEAILNRSWIPTQDSPGIRQTWDASITVPKSLTAVMSAEMLTPEGRPASGDRHTFRFRMDKPVAPYLIALAIGNLEFKALGPRTGVWTEPGMLKKAAWEFADLPKFVDAAEDLYGPYRWGRYDVLVLPPSFPYGGMENPRLTFATPTVIAGDRSLVSLVAHELAHSWSGNLVTNATWDDFWLNEGFTTYFENRIMEKLYGKRRAAMEADLGWSGLQEAIKDAGGPSSPDTQLHLNLTADRDPDAGMGEIAYEKGATFLRTIEKAVGRERFDEYLRGYFDRHAFQPQTTAGFLKDIRAHLFKDDPDLAKRIGLEQWVYEPGIPDNAVHVKSDAFPAMDMAAKEYAEGGLVASVPDDVSTQERVRFLNRLPRDLSRERLAALDERFDFSHAGNSEIRFAWLMLALGNRYPPAAESAEQFLTSQGRRKFVAPLFEVMMNEGDWGQSLARRIYAKARPGYHSVTSGTVDEIVGWNGA